MEAAGTSHAFAIPVQDVQVSSTEEQVVHGEQNQGSLHEAEELKKEGNDYFRESRWDEALASYRMALGRIPKRPTSKEHKEHLTSGDEPPVDLYEQAEAGPAPRDTHIQPESSGGPEYSKLRAVLNANIAACYVKLDEPKEVVTACTAALVDDPKYVKVLQRRAAANEQLNTWSSLTGAQQDYTTLLEILPPASSQHNQVKVLQHSLKPRLEEAQKRETGEMFDKLKGIGNSILGNFGLSTDNFQFAPNGQGGYSMNFVR